MIYPETFVLYLDFLLAHTLHCRGSGTLVGVAHHVSFMRPYGLFDIAAVSVANSLTLYPYLDAISEKLDYIGINYYGQVMPYSYLETLTFLQFGPVGTKLIFFIFFFSF